MNKLEFIGLKFDNPVWNEIGLLIKDKYSPYINFDKCIEMGFPNGFESECHCTLLYNKTYNYGPNFTFTKLKFGSEFRNEFNKLINKSGYNKELILNPVIIDTFDNEDSRVIKINLENSNMYPEMKSIHSELEKLCEEPSTYSDYKAHLTLTYFKSDTSDDVIEILKSELFEFYKDYLFKFNLKSLMFSSTSVTSDFKQVIDLI